MYHCHLLHHEDEGMMGSFLVLDPNAIGIKEIKEESNSVKVYPNPAKDFLTIDLSEIIDKESIIKIYNSLGQIIFEEKKAESEKIAITTSFLGKGIYFIQINEKNKVSSKKVIIE
jgi:aminopeptidase YwaD